MLFSLLIGQGDRPALDRSQQLVPFLVDGRQRQAFEHGHAFAQPVSGAIVAIRAKGGIEQGFDKLRINFRERNDAGQCGGLVNQEKRALLRFEANVERHRLQLPDGAAAARRLTCLGSLYA